MEQQDKFYKGLFFGAMLGTVGGTLMGLLFAPYKGSETQQIISGKVKHAIDKAAECSSETVENSSHIRGLFPVQAGKIRAEAPFRIGHP